MSVGSSVIGVNSDLRLIRSVRTCAAGLGEVLAAALVAALVGRMIVAVVNRMPFVEPSWLPETVGATLGVGLVALVAWMLLRRSTGPRALWATGVLAPALFASGHLSFVLHGTPHYLFGLGGDQLNRVVYLGRFADSPALDDAFYADAVPFYPPQWFWVGGRLAALLDIPAWLFYKPYAIVTMAIAGAIAFVAWRWLVPVRVAVLFGLLTAVVGVHLNAYEPYSWILLCLLPQVVSATLLLCGRIRGGASWRDPGAGVLTAAIGVYLGWAAIGYTLVAGFAATVVGLLVLTHAWETRRRRGVTVSLLGHLSVIAGLSAVMALLFWHRHLGAVLAGVPTERSVADDFAPESASRWPLPMTEPSVTGALCLIGTGWLLVVLWPRGPGGGLRRAGKRLEARVGVRPGAAGPEPVGRGLVSSDTAALLARTFAVLALGVLLWYLLSGLRAVTGHTLLPFRLIPVMTLALLLAGALGALALTRWAAETSPAGVVDRTRFVSVVLAVLAGVQLVQHVSEEDRHFAATALDTPPPPAVVLGAIDELTGPGSDRPRRPSELVALSADPAVLAYRPYRWFQAPAQAYATPTGRYSARLDEIRRWSAAGGPRATAAAMADGPFRGPDVLVLDRADDGSWVFPATINTMPREANNEREDIRFSPADFADPSLFGVRLVDRYAVIVRR